jgi:hypothetical protein
MANYEQSIAEASSASDGRPDLYDTQHASWQIFASDEEPEVHYIPLDTTQPISTMVEQIVEELHIEKGLTANQENCDGTENHVYMSVTVL